MTTHTIDVITCVCAVAAVLLAGCSQQGTGHGDSDITAAAFGDIYDMSDGAKPIGKGGGHNDVVSGDTWYTTWAADDTAYVIHDDGLGFDNLGGMFARTRLCRFDGNPNVSTDGFRGVNLNPGLWGDTMPNSKATPEWRIGYSSSVSQHDGVLYTIRHNWSPSDALWPPIDSSILKSPDGGKTWINHLGQVNAPIPDKDHAMFPSLPWSWLTFIQYGKGNAVPDADNLDKYVYLTASQHLARVPRAKLADLNKNDFQYYKGGGLDGMLDSSWSSQPADGRPVQYAGASGASQKEGADAAGLCNVVYNMALNRYVATGWGVYFAPGEGGHDKGKARLIILTAKHPWGPWREAVAQGIWGRVGWVFLLCNKFTTSDGLKMWYTFCGEYKGDLYNYGFQYLPLYLSSGAVDRYEAENAKLHGTTIASSYPSHSGSGYVTGFAKAGDSAAFAIDKVSGTGWHIVRIRYTSPQANGGTLSVYVNGKKARRVTLSLNDCNRQPHESWIDRSDIYYLNDGANTFEIRQDEGDSSAGVMVDYIAVSREPTHDEGTNLAPSAKLSASSGDARGAIKGCIDGRNEWVAKGVKDEWLQLDWPAARSIHKVVLYDRTSPRDQVLSGTLTFSDGTSIHVGKLQNDGQAGNVVTFPGKTVTWVRFTINTVRPGTEAAGLGEMQVY
jgi:hypothetical protein